MSDVKRKGAYDASRVEQKPIDTRRFSAKLKANMNNPGTLSRVAFFMLFVMLFSLITPLVAALLLLPFYYISRKYMHPKLRLHNLPFRVPAHLGVPDGSKKDFTEKGDVIDNLPSFKPEGTQYWGLSRENNQQVWASLGDLKTHMSVLGGTGSGKTELLYTLTINQMIQDSGFIYVDAKGDISLQVRLLEFLRRFDRQEDLLTISYSAGNRDLLSPQRARITNTFNMMSSSSDTMLIEIISGMVSTSETGGDIWEGRCLAFVAALTRPLVFMRDKGIIDLAPSTYTEYMDLVSVEELVYGAKKGERNNPDEKGIEKTLASLENFLTSLPGYLESKYKHQEQKTNEQFGYIAMQLTRVFNDLGFNYGHIFDAKVGEIDVSDVVLNRRCLTILLPSLERSPSTLVMLGKLIIGSIKQMMAGSLGSDVEGVTRLVVDSRPTNARNVFRVILDEVGYIMVPGMSIIPAQARSLNISMVFASQTFSDLKRGNALEADGIWDNTSLKLIGRLMSGEETSSETWQKIVGMAGYIQEATLSGYNKKTTPLGVSYTASEHISIQRTPRIELEYVRHMQDGEFLLFGAKKLDGGKDGENMLIPMKVMHAASQTMPSVMLLNDLIPVSKAGLRVDDSGGKEELKELLKENKLLDWFADMSKDKNFSALNSFNEISEEAYEQSKYDESGLMVIFYQKLYDCIGQPSKSDDEKNTNALEQSNVINKGNKNNQKQTSASDDFATIVKNPKTLENKNLFAIDANMSKRTKQMANHLS